MPRGEKSGVPKQDNIPFASPKHRRVTHALHEVGDEEGWEHRGLLIEGAAALAGVTRELVKKVIGQLERLAERKKKQE